MDIYYCLVTLHAVFSGRPTCPVPKPSRRGSSFSRPRAIRSKAMNFPVLPMLPISARRLALCSINGWKRTPAPCSPAGSSNRANVHPALPSTPRPEICSRQAAIPRPVPGRIPCPIMFLRIDRRHRLKFEVPREVQHIFKFLSDASPPPPSRTTLRVVRRRGVPRGRSRSVRPTCNEALLPGAPPWLAAARFPCSRFAFRSSHSSASRSPFSASQPVLRLGTFIGIRRHHGLSTWVAIVRAHFTAAQKSTPPKQSVK